MSPTIMTIFTKSLQATLIIPEWGVAIISIVGTGIFILVLSLALKKYRMYTYYKNVVNDDSSNESSEDNTKEVEEEQRDANSFVSTDLHAYDNSNLQMDEVL